VLTFVKGKTAQGAPAERPPLTKAAPSGERTGDRDGGNDRHSIEQGNGHQKGGRLSSSAFLFESTAELARPMTALNSVGPEIPSIERGSGTSGRSTNTSSVASFRHSSQARSGRPLPSAASASATW